MDRLELVPGDVRGGGNITILKDDFKTDENTNVYGIHLGEESTFVNGKLMTVYNSRLTTYHSGVADKWALTFTAPRVVSPGDTVTVNFTALCGDDAVGSTEARLVLRSIDGETVFWEDTMVISSGSGSFSVTVPSVDTVLCEWVLFISHYFYQNASCHRSVVVADLDFDFNVVGDKDTIQIGETANIVGVLTGTIGDDVIGIPGQTVNFYELWTPGLRVSAPVVQVGETKDIKAQLIDSVDGSLVRESGHTVNVYIDDAPPVPTRLDVNFDKTILSYADGDSAYVVVRVYDQYGDAMPNQSVSVSMSDGVSWTLETDMYGQGSFSYVSQGDGDVTFTFECSNLQETFVVSDRLLYDTNEYSRTGTGSATSVVTNNKTWDNTIDWEMTSEIKVTGNSCRIDVVPPTESLNHHLGIGKNGSGQLSTYVGKASSGEEAQTHSQSMSNNTYYTVKVVKEGTTVKFYFEGTLIRTDSTTATSWIGNYSTESVKFTTWQTNTIYMRNLSVMPL